MPRIRSDHESLIADNLLELSDAKRALQVGYDITVYRQPGGCLEINQEESDGTQDVIHVCDPNEWEQLALAMMAVRHRVPVRDNGVGSRKEWDGKGTRLEDVDASDRQGETSYPNGSPDGRPRYPNGAPAMNERNEPLDMWGNVVTPLPPGVEGVRIVGIRFVL